MNLNSLIVSAKTVHDRKMELLSIKSVGFKDAIIGNGYVFSSQNDVGEYQLSFRFDNDGEEYALTETINVVSGLRPAVNNAKDLPFSFEGNNSITFSSDVAKIVEEINELWNSGKYPYVICCAARSIAELCLTKIDNIDSNILMNKTDLKTRLEEFADYLLDESNHKLRYVCNQTLLKFHNTKNLVQQLKDNAGNIASVLHLGAHRSATGADIENLYNKMHIHLTLLIQCVEGLYLITSTA